MMRFFGGFENCEDRLIESQTVAEREGVRNALTACPQMSGTIQQKSSQCWNILFEWCHHHTYKTVALK